MYNKILGILLLLIIFALSLAYLNSDVLVENTTFSKHSNTNKSHFTGDISEIDTGCAHDGVCKVKVNGLWIITDLGGDPTPEMEKERGNKGKIFQTDATLIGNIMGDQYIGRKVEVFATVIDEDTLSLYGDGENYIKFLEH